MTLVLLAHPYPDRSRANRALAQAIEGLEGVSVRSLYDLYPEFSIDVAAERAALMEADLVVFQHPLYWYSAPALFKLWLERVLGAGFAYGSRFALEGKRCLWAVTTGSPSEHYAADGPHGLALSAFEPAIRQTALFCRMRWLEPFVVHAAHRIDQAELDRIAATYRERVASLTARSRAEAPEATTDA